MFKHIFMRKSVLVLDDGFVRYVDHYGSDRRIVQAARVSYGHGSKGKRKDEKLINYLTKNGHTSPFEMAEMTFHVRVPIYIWRQWIRHRTANVNEVSGRYTELDTEFHVVEPDEWRMQSSGNKQGSEGFVSPDIGMELSLQQERLHDIAREVYKARLEAGVSREMARIDLPLSLYTEAYWKTDLHNLRHFLRLRLDSHAQQEIREYAKAIAYFVEKLYPFSWSAFQRHVLGE